MKITPLLMVEKVEASLPFWMDRLGFEKKVEVPDHDGLAFAILSLGGAEIMLQTIESVRKDEPKFAPTTHANAASLFVEVEEFDDILKRLEGYPIEMAERTTFYGMREIGVYEPGGHIVVFAARTAQQAS